jgi:Uma2 family endonuclease
LGETPLHVRNLHYVREPLEVWFADDPFVFVAANMFVYHRRGDRNKHVSPDVFVVRGIPKETYPPRRKYLLWEEKKAPDLVIELTSESTREEDVDDKRGLYQDVLGVREYFLFDPYAEYLDPPLQGYRLVRRKYVPIEPVDGRLPSEVLALHLVADGELLRLYDPAHQSLLPIPPEVRQAWLDAEAARAQAEKRQRKAEAARKREEAARKREEAARKQAESEVERLRRELEELRRRLPEQP